MAIENNRFLNTVIFKGWVNGEPKYRESDEDHRDHLWFLVKSPKKYITRKRPHNYFPCVAWGRQAKYIAGDLGLREDDYVVITGEIDTRYDEETGSNRFEVLTKDIEILHGFEERNRRREDEPSEPDEVPL